MTADVSSLGGVPTDFDFESQSGILFLLRAVRTSSVSDSDKNKLKDLIFLYNTGGKDETVKNTLRELLAALAITPATAALAIESAEAESKVPASVSVTDTTTDPYVGQFPAGRLVPQFNSSVGDNVATTPNLTASEANKVVVRPMNVTAQATASTINPVVVKMPLNSPVTVARPVNVPPLIKPDAAPILETVVTPAKTAVSETVVTTPTPVTPSAPSITSPAVTSENNVLEARMERIRTIKSDINGRIGNPVNLIDVDNGLGREYMSALLEAMKLLGSAPEADSNKAMSRLETVYQQVLKLIDTPSPAAPVASVQAMPVNDSVVTPEPLMPDLSKRSKVSEKDTPVETVSGWDTPKFADQPEVEKLHSVAEMVAPQPAVTSSRLSTPPAETLQPVIDSVRSEPATAPLKSVAEANAPLRSITELPTADEVSELELNKSNPLYTKDVDAGLEQLLGEWSIFKKSGLFGTGPSGRQHPLYAKLSLLQVPLILAGRFEGSTQEIKQSITDYMNGWRYEQGIIYEANETLDQYLRRVIRHIIDLQKTKRRS